MTVRSSVVTEGLGEPRGLAVRANGNVVVADADGGRLLEVDGDGSIEVLASGLKLPAGVALDGSERAWVADEGSGELLLLEGGSPKVVLGGLANPQGVGAFGSNAFVVEAGAGRLLAVNESGATETVASGIPVGLDDGVREPLGGMPELLPGPIRPFAGVTADEAGRVYVSADDAGTVLAFES